ncbi:hypothetical protein LXT21_19405 [Myxococcus sp. K38C18041901]|uniref:hypothetical protein n=1 Tax=Myxococcus guangdongensis TaxID=2906760 RepID=UPI0020A6EFD0|nr:hypothetical protein [Myxococcus guangdongensis]MCP3060956.1 hypothetical protein [Myxococcus guangdongensis]
MGKLMKTIKVDVSYRPVRVGWCVSSTMRSEIEAAIKHSHLLWGGRCNPLVPVDLPEMADEIVNAFQPDLLLSADGSVDAYAFSRRYAYMWGSSYEYRLFDGGYRGVKTLRFVDVFEAARRVYELEAVRGDDRKTLAWFEWDEADPLASVLLAMLGRLPAAGELDVPYEDIIKKELWARSVGISAGAPLPNEILGARSLNRLTMFDLKCVGWGWQAFSGLFVGDSSNLLHVLQYWNVRASGQNVLFYDPAFPERYQSLLLSVIGAHDVTLPSGLPGFSNEYRNNPFLILMGRNGGRRIEHPASVIANPGRPTVVRLPGLKALGVVGEGRLKQVSFQLPSMPVSGESNGQKLMVTARPREFTGEDERMVFEYPPVLELNQYYSEKVVGADGFVRSENDGVGVLIEAGSSVLTFYALDGRELVAKIFEVSGIRAEVSQPGLVAERLIRQMGGLQRCRVFKVAGVRDLIRRHTANQSFTLREAMACIGGAKDVRSGRGFESYGDLYIEPRREGKLKPPDVFSFLVKKEVFRVGVKVRCSACMLDFWVSIDEMKTHLSCEYCGADVHVAPQLRDGDWAYRRSGLFGRTEHQDGSIPVILALQFLDSEIGHRGASGVVYAAAMNLKFEGRGIDCETDFVAVARNIRGGVELVVGECKGGNEISVDDIDNLNLVADCFEGSGIEVYIVLSKASEFTPQELERVRLLPDEKRRRFILLGVAELESYGFSPRRRDVVGYREHYSPLRDLADDMSALYLKV